MEDREVRVGIVDMKKCTREQKEQFVWLAVAMSLSGKKCPVCDKEWECREDVERRKPITGYDGEAICKSCWFEYMKRRDNGRA